MTKKEHLLNAIRYTVEDQLFYYNRKYDNDLSIDDIENLIINREITKEEMLEAFDKALQAIITKLENRL